MSELEEFEITSYDISNAKKDWKKQHLVQTYSDEMSPLENASFKGDEKFLDKIKALKKARQDLTDYMNLKINLMRKAEMEKVAQIKPIKSAEFKEPFE
jgi:hypothetical protein